jgi:hypothetical protein
MAGVPAAYVFWKTILLCADAEIQTIAASVLGLVLLGPLLTMRLDTALIGPISLIILRLLGKLVQKFRR